MASIRVLPTDVHEAGSRLRSLSPRVLDARARLTAIQHLGGATGNAHAAEAFTRMIAACVEELDAMARQLKFRGTGAAVAAGDYEATDAVQMAIAPRGHRISP